MLVVQSWKTLEMLEVYHERTGDTFDSCIVPSMNALMRYSRGISSNITLAGYWERLESHSSAMAFCLSLSAILGHWKIVCLSW